VENLILKKSTIEVTHKSSGNSKSDIDFHKFRLKTIELVRNSVLNPKQGPKIIGDFVNEVSQSPSVKDERIVGLLADLKGQITEALSTDAFFDKWGRHYLPSLVRAHELQQCNNFKDPGIQCYGGKTFSKLRSQLEDIFVKLDPPKATIKSMNTYYNQSAPCFDGSCQTLIYDNSNNVISKRLDLLKKGDRVVTDYTDGHINFSKIECIIKTNCLQSKCELVELNGGLLVTPYHPVRINNMWRFPKDLAPVMERTCLSVFSFVLSNHHCMIINGIECITLGHNIQNDIVASHPYFGSNLVIKDLKKIKGWSNGLIEFDMNKKSNMVIKDRTTGLVCGFNHEAIISC